MKKRIYIIEILIINLFVITLLHINMVNEVSVGGSIKNKYIEAMNYSYNSKSNTTEENTTNIENTYQTEKATENSTKTNTKNETEKTTDKLINSNDNIKVGIVITSTGTNIYHKDVKMQSKGSFNIYYGKNLQNVKTVEGCITIDYSSKYFKNNKKIKITSDKKISIANIQKADLEGDFFIYKKSEGLVVVNDINVEKYLCGVVASEMPLKFEKEALKAQAVCARTYTYVHLKNKKYKEYNAIMDDTVSYQAYGQNAATKNVKEAVKETKGEVMTHDNKLINAYYFSTSCGYTTDYKIWGDKKYKYLSSKYVSKEDNLTDVSTGDYFNKFIKSTANSYENKCAFYRWNVTINTETIENKVYDVMGKNIGKIESICINKRGAGGIASEVVITGKNDKCIIDKQYDIRQIFSPYGYNLYLNDGNIRTELNLLPSAFIVIEKVSDNKYKITGGGFGHGSGMSQYGANEMAKKGMTYKEILQFFYSDITCGHTDIH